MTDNPSGAPAGELAARAARLATSTLANALDDAGLHHNVPRNGDSGISDEDLETIEDMKRRLPDEPGATKKKARANTEMAGRLGGGVQSAQHRLGLLVDDLEKYAGRTDGRPAALFPIAHRPWADTERACEFILTQTQLLARGGDIDAGDLDNVLCAAGSVATRIGNSVHKPSHHRFKSFLGHRHSP
jgi:hypothetical protein